jgi:hypothetical protein
MPPSTKLKTEKEKVLKKLLKMWRSSRDMQQKADQLISMNPGLQNNAVPKNTMKF